MAVRHAVGLPNVGVFGSVRALVELAVLAEHSGWDGVHLWDHLLYHDPEWPVASPVATAAAVAAATERVRIVLTLTLPRRQVQDVAQDTAGIAALAGGRLTVLGIIGSMDREFTEFGLDPDMKARGRALDERLARLQELWRQWGAPEIPLWCGGRWPRKPGLRRAARFDGVLLTFADQRNSMVPVETFADAVGFVRGLAGQPTFRHRGGGRHRAGDSWRVHRPVRCGRRNLVGRGDGLVARRPNHGPRSDHRRPARLSTVAQAEGILAGYTRTVAQISGDDRLTPEAKAVDLAKAYTKAQTDLSGVRATVEQQEAETVERLASWRQQGDQKPRRSLTMIAVTRSAVITLLMMRMLLTPLGTP